LRAEYHSHSLEDTFAVGGHIAALVRNGGIVTLAGDLGTGKTHLTKGICRALGYTGIVSSPTFAIINEYQGDIPIAHVDLYRLELSSELRPLGLEELMGEGRVMIVEWPEIALSMVPADAVRVRCAYGRSESDREFVVETA
jgi:tRNA threonylcarbamoyladenosine biosynthesis protein TsaE